MPTYDDSSQDHPLPLFLSEQAHEVEVGETSGIAVISWRILKVSLLVVTALGIGFLLDDPVTHFASVKASLFDTSALQPASDQSTPAIQSASGAQAPPPAAGDAPTREEIAAAFASAARQSQAQIGEPPAETLLKQFQAWATREDAQPPVERVQPVEPARPAQPVQDASAQVAEDAEAPVRHIHKRRHVQNARAEMRPQQNRRNAWVQPPPAQDPRAQEQAVQNAQAPSFLQTLGLQR
jgi:hypothetical protein